jgi:4'-phosphopantetheinyl transferase
VELPAPGDVHVWSVELERPGGEVGALGGALTEDELLRASAFKVDDARRRFVVSRAALRALLGAYLGAAPATLLFAASAHGKPRLDDPPSPLRFNLAHSGGLALIAVAREVEVGVDLEEIRPRRDLDGVSRRVFTRDERDAIDGDESFYRHWVAKEAFVKATGRGIASLRSFEVLLEAPGGARLVHVGGDHAEASRWTLAPLDAAPGFAAAAVVAATRANVHQPKRFDPLR